ncbi:MAG: DUF418 domain-containing protein [Acidobacteriota bacterium]
MEKIQATLDHAPTAPAYLVSPVAQQERIATLDILRGWAIFGVLLMDIEALYRPPATWSGSDQGVYSFLAIFGESKFWTLLSFLFGLGFSMQLVRAEERGRGFIAPYRRRLLALVLIGVAQRLLLTWGGHFLIVYGAMGFLLFALRGLPSRTLLPAALAFMLIPLAYSDGLNLIRERRLANSETRAEVLRSDAERSAAGVALRAEQREAANGGYPQRLAFRVKSVYRMYIANAYESLAGRFINPPLTYVNWLGQLGLFLVGMYVGRRRILQDIPGHLPLIRRVLIWGLALGLAAGAVRYSLTCATGDCWPDRSNQPYATHLLISMLRRFGDPALAFANGAALVLLAQRQLWLKLFAPLAAAGRMALTNYLLMALLVGVLAPTFGLGVYRRIGPTLASALAVAIFATLMLLSTWWLKHFRFGPAEWLWRTLTYGKLQPMRLQPSLAPAGVG